MPLSSEHVATTAPIITFAIREHFDVGTFKEIRQAIFDFATQAEQPVYVIVQLGNIEVALDETLRILSESQRNDSGSEFSNSIHMLLFAGYSAFASMYRDALQRRGVRYGISIYPDMDSAIKTIELDYERQLVS